MIQNELYNGSAAASFVTPGEQIDDLTPYSVQCAFSGGAGNLEGTLTVEASNDNVTYITVTGSSQAVTASTNHMYNVSDAAYRWFRIRWVYTSGTGNLRILDTIKQPANRY